MRGVVTLPAVSGLSRWAGASWRKVDREREQMRTQKTKDTLKQFWGYTELQVIRIRRNTTTPNDTVTVRKMYLGIKDLILLGNNAISGDITRSKLICSMRKNGNKTKCKLSSQTGLN